MTNKKNIVFPCKPGDTVFVHAKVDGEMQVVPAVVESIDCYQFLFDGKAASHFRVYVDHEYVHSKVTPWVIQNRYIFTPQEIFADAEEAEAALKDGKVCLLSKGLPGLEYALGVKCEPGENVFIGTKQDFLHSVVPAIVKEMRIIFDKKDHGYAFDETIIVDHEFTHKNPGDKEKTVHPRNRDFFLPNELHLTKEQAALALRN